jgi:hypothetical protein
MTTTAEPFSGPAVRESVEGLLQREEDVVQHLLLCAEELAALQIQLLHVADQQPAGQHVPRLLELHHQFNTRWIMLHSTASSLAQLLACKDHRLTATRLQVELMHLERGVSTHPAVMAALLSATQAMVQRQAAGGVMTDGGHTDGAPGWVERAPLAALQRYVQQCRREGYHPPDPAAYSAVLSRQEKLDILQDLR